MPSLLLRRTGAFIIDVTLLFLVLGPLGYVVQRGLGLSPSSPREIYATILINFSIPVWTYFAWSDRSRTGATLGKRLLSLRTERMDRERVGAGQALGRTAIKMLPWEISHASAFLFAPALGVFSFGNWAGIGCSYLLAIAYIIIAWRTGGQRSVHDVAFSTRASLTPRTTPRRRTSVPPGGS